MANGNRLTHRKRDGSVLTFSYDNLNRLILKVVPERQGLDPIHTRDVHYGYDLRNLQLFARFDSATGQGVTNAWDAFGRPISSSITLGGITRTLTYQHREDGARTRITHPDGQWFGMLYDPLSRLVRIAENDDGTGASSAYLATFYYNADGTPEALLRGMTNPTSDYVYTIYGYDPVQRPTSIVDQFSDGASANVARTFAWNPANQIVSEVRDNDLYAWTSHVAVSRSYTTNGLNQYSNVGGVGFGYDANGNLISDGVNSYTYDVENRLIGRSGTVTLLYDPLGRLWQTSGTGFETIRYLYDGDALVAEYDGTGNQLARYVHGPGADVPMVWYGGATVTQANRRYLVANHQGSITAIADATGTAIAINRYDEYGIPAATNAGRFQFTGQLWLPELGMYHYKARIYSPTLGRFLQTDPVGYADQYNLYAYVGDDPVNLADPSGMAICTGCSGYTIDYDSENRAAAQRPRTAMPADAEPGGGGRFRPPMRGTRGEVRRGTWNPRTAYRRASSIAEEELARTRRIAPRGGHNDIYDAERHARWTYRMAREIGPNWAQSISDAHEYEGLVQGQPLREYRMDINNNRVGIQAARRGHPIPNTRTPGLAYIDAAGDYNYNDN